MEMGLIKFWRRLPGRRGSNRSGFASSFSRIYRSNEIWKRHINLCARKNIKGRPCETINEIRRSKGSKISFSSFLLLCKFEFIYLEKFLIHLRFFSLPSFFPLNADH